MEKHIKLNMACCRWSHINHSFNKFNEGKAYNLKSFIKTMHILLKEATKFIISCNKFQFENKEINNLRMQKLNEIKEEELKEAFLKILREDEEFRYAILGSAGLEEILKRLDRHEEILNKHEEILIKLREDFNEMRKEQIKLGEEQAKLREDFNEMLKIVKGLQESYIRIEQRIDSLYGAMIHGFWQMSKFAGVTFEEFIRNFLTERLRKAGEIPKNAKLKKAIINGEEINIFLKSPLIVGEVTSHAETIEEIDKLMRKAKIAERKYKDKARKILIALTATKEAAKEIMEKAKKEGIEAIIGKIIAK